MALREIQNQVKRQLFETWLPDKPGGLKGLINMAADAALAVLGERVEFLEGEIEAYQSLGEEKSVYGADARDDVFQGDVTGLNASDDANEPDDSCDCEADDLGGGVHIEDCPKYLAPVDQTKYLCPQCAVTHQRASAVGARHAHLFYGGVVAVSHLEHCPHRDDPGVLCNCGAIPANAAERAEARREGV